jgi:hypothetical protein
MQANSSYVSRRQYQFYFAFGVGINQFLTSFSTASTSAEYNTTVFNRKEEGRVDIAPFVLAVPVSGIGH